MVAPLSDTDVAPGTPRSEDAVLSRLNQIATRLESLSHVSHETRERLDHLENRLDDANHRQQRSFEQVEQNVEERLHSRLGDTVRAVIQPELGVIRPPIEAQAARLAAVESRLERVETIQVESMNALDVRFGDLAFQTRLALSAGGLVTLAAVMVLLLK